MERYGNYVESSYRVNFEQGFDFLSFNQYLIQQHCESELLIAMDASYLPKSGKKTYGRGKYWSGVAGQSKWGLEITGLAVIDVNKQTSFHLEAVQTSSAKEREVRNQSLLDYYLQIVVDKKETLAALSRYLVVDAYFSKYGFVEGVISQSSLEVISRLRNDADVRYLYQGEPTGKKGRPKLYQGKVDWQHIDQNYFELVEQNQDYKLYSAILYSKSLKRKIKVAYCVFLDTQGQVSHYSIFFSTDLELTACEILQYYRLRFQQEFLFRDAKQFTGLTSCQAISKNKLHTHVNFALTSVSIAKAIELQKCKDEQKFIFSMSNIKRLFFNELFLNRIFSVFGFQPNSEKNPQQVEQIRNFGLIAA